MADVKAHYFTSPVIVELGKVPKKQLRRMEDGQGKLFEEMQVVIEEVIEAMGEHAEGKEILPIILMYGTKRKKKRVAAVRLPNVQL